MINPQELREHSFFESHCWAKLKTIIFCAVMWHGKNSESAEFVKVASLDFSETAAFTHAFERWSGVAPSAWRARHRAD